MYLNNNEYLCAYSYSVYAAPYIDIMSYNMETDNMIANLNLEFIYIYAN